MISFTIKRSALDAAKATSNDCQKIKLYHKMFVATHDTDSLIFFKNTGSMISTVNKTK